MVTGTAKLCFPPHRMKLTLKHSNVGTGTFKVSCP